MWKVSIKGGDICEESRQVLSLVAIGVFFVGFQLYQLMTH